MSDPAAPAAPAAPPPAEHPDHGPFGSLGSIFRHDQTAPIPAGLKAALRDHAGRVFDLAADVLASPGAAELEPKILELVASAAALGKALL